MFLVGIPLTSYILGFRKIMKIIELLIASNMINHLKIIFYNKHLSKLLEYKYLIEFDIHINNQ